MKPLSAYQGMILELKAKKTIKIGTNASIVPAQPAGDWTDTGNNWKARSSNDRKGTTATTTITITTTASAITTTATTTADSKQVAANATSANAVQRGSKDDPCALAQPQFAVQRSRVMKEENSLLPVVAWEKASEEERQRKDDDDDWDKLSCNNNLVDSLPIPSKQPFQPTPDLPRRQDATPMMSSRTSKRTIMSPSVSSLSSLGNPSVSTNEDKNGFSNEQSKTAQTYRIRGLPGKVRSITLEDVDVSSKARFIIS